jgi:hypothetical protein
MLQQQRNQALDAVAELAAQLNAMRDHLASIQGEIERLRSAAADTRETAMASDCAEAAIYSGANGTRPGS